MTSRQSVLKQAVIWLILIVLACLGGPAAAQPSTAAPLAISPRITTPASGSSHIFGNPITFHAVDDGGVCPHDPFAVKWHFRQVGGGEWEQYRFTPERMLGVGGQNRLLPLPGKYEVKAEMCCGAFQICAESPAITFRVGYDAPIIDQIHPAFADDDDLCWLDWDSQDENEHVTTAHYNVYWNTTGLDCAGRPVATRIPTAAELGLMECTYAWLDRWMTSPLDNASIFRRYDDYASLTHLTFWMGTSGGGGASQPQGVGFGVGVNGRVMAHELFHTFDYGGNPLHNKRFDRRYEGNAYHFYHEGPTRIEQTVSPDASTLWGYRTDLWPLWTPLDLGFLELDYDAGPFWSYAINNFGDEFSHTPRESWTGPSFDACNRFVQRDSQERELRPHNLKLFEAWNGEVRNRIRAEIGAGPELADYPDECDAHQAPDESFLYVGQLEPGCSQTLEYEMAILQDLVTTLIDEEGTPLEESLLLDLAVQFAQAYPPQSLLSAMPDEIACSDRPGVTFARGFAALRPGCPVDPEPPPTVPVDAPVCDELIAVNEHDFYARIRFRILDPAIRYLRLQANDDATLYVDGLAVIGEAVPGDGSSSDFPNASTTYADQRYQWVENHAPVSSAFPIVDPTGRRFEIEWVNRGDSRGNYDWACSADNDRYLLLVEGSATGYGGFTPLEPEQVQITSARFWPNQGSGYPGFAAPPDWDDHTTPIAREVQLRPVAWLERPFLLPALGVHYHPVRCPAGYHGRLEVILREDLTDRTHNHAVAHLLTVGDPASIAWQGALEHPNDTTWRTILDCGGMGGPARLGDDPALILATSRLTTHDEEPGAPLTMGAVHYTVIVKPLALYHVYLPTVMRE